MKKLKKQKELMKLVSGRYAEERKYTEVQQHERNERALKAQRFKRTQTKDIERSAISEYRNHI